LCTIPAIIWTEIMLDTKAADTLAPDLPRLLTPNQQPNCMVKPIWRCQLNAVVDKRPHKLRLPDLMCGSHPASPLSGHCKDMQ
jgi:hypothetical protein